LPTELHGSVYTGGLVHVTDMHATLASLGGASLSSKGALDGMDMWDTLINNAKSPRQEVLLNYDPCSGHGTCSGVEWSYRMGDMKLNSGVSSDTWYPVPTTGNNTPEVLSSTAQTDVYGNVWWPQEHYLSAADAVGLSPACTAAVKSACDSSSECSQCISKNWATLSKTCTRAPEARVAAVSCGSTPSPSPASQGLSLFNISADPYEQHNLILNSTGPYQALISTIQAKVDSIVTGDDYMAPCNIPGGSCYDSDPKGSEVAAAHQEDYPWVGICEDMCTTQTCGSTCDQLIKTYDCASNYCPTCKWAGWCDKTCGECK